MFKHQLLDKKKQILLWGRSRKLWGVILYKKILLFLSLLLSFSIQSVHASSYFDVTIYREESNFYEDSFQNLIIQTSFCYELVYSDNAVLRVDNPSGNLIGKLLFSNGNECDVKQIYEE